jgi:hypothetical protein
MMSNRQRKKMRKEKGCTSKRTYKSAAAAREADPLMRPYRCKVCYSWHNATHTISGNLQLIKRDNE